MKKSKVFLSAVLVAAAVCSAAYAAVAVEDGASSVESSDTSETSEATETSNSGSTSNYLELHLSGGSGRIEYRDGDQLCECPTVGATRRFHIPVGCSGTITLTRPGYTILSIKIGNSTTQRDMTKVSDGVYSFTIEEGDTDMYVIYEGEESDNSSDLTSNYLILHMSGGKATVDFRVNSNQTGKYPEVDNQARFSIEVGCSGTITINRPGYTIISVKIGSSTAKRDMEKVSDIVYGFTVEEGDTDIYVIFEGDNSEAESSAPASSTPKPAPTTPTRPTYTERDDYDEPTTHESVPEVDTNPDTGIAFAIPAAALSTAAVIAAAKKRK